MISEIVSQFLDFEQINSSQALGDGHIHQTLLVHIQQEKIERQYVLQRINKQVFKRPADVMHNLTLLSEFLKQQPSYGMKILSPIPTKQGASYFQTVEDEYWRMLPYFHHTVSYTNVEQPEQAFAAAKAFGHFSRTLENFPTHQLATTIPNFHNSLNRYDSFEKVLLIAPINRLLSADEMINFLKEHIAIFEEIDQLHLPSRVVHNDTKIDNVLIDKNSGKGVCVIDLDTVMPGTVLSDFGDMVRTFTNSEKEDSVYLNQVEARFDIFESLSKGYLSEMSALLTDTEKKHLLTGAKWIILEQCLRFLTDYLEEDRYYPVTHAEHNLVRAKNQRALFESIVRQETKMRNCLERIWK